MASTLDEIDPPLERWIARQSLFVAPRAPKIIRLHGRGEVIMPEDERFAGLAGDWNAAVTEAAHRSIVRVDVERIARSCGDGVPLMGDVGDRVPVSVPA